MMHVRQSVPSESTGNVWPSSHLCGSVTCRLCGKANLRQRCLRAPVPRGTGKLQLHKPGKPARLDKFAGRQHADHSMHQKHKAASFPHDGATFDVGSCVCGAVWSCVYGAEWSCVCVESSVDDAWSGHCTFQRTWGPSQRCDARRGGMAEC